MQVGIHLASFEWPGAPERIAETLGEIASAAEEAGCDPVSVMDHFFQLERFRLIEEPMLEAYTALGFLAACTRRVQLRVLVTGVTYRHPGLLAKIVTTLDVLSRGRGELGIGAAWYEREHPYREWARRFPFFWLRRPQLLLPCLQRMDGHDARAGALGPCKR